MSLSLSVYECECVWVWVYVSLYVCGCVSVLMSISLHVCVWRKCGWHSEWSLCVSFCMQLCVIGSGKEGKWEVVIIMQFCVGYFAWREREICVVSVDSPCVRTFFIRIIESLYFFHENIILSLLTAPACTHWKHKDHVCLARALNYENYIYHIKKQQNI